ncbi:MAG: GntR family transcriptional regulator [Bryobacterales bacterium]|jgi:DNA-binding GntR family transcriptional regulator|nr:GntR family transcriptional regulator [Bryobacterales bacterium]
MALSELKVIGVRESIVERIKRALLEGEFAPGESLSEPSLAAQLRVGRGSVREALLVLAQEGLLVHNHNRGFATVKLTRQDSDEIQEVRLRLESLALERARTRIDEGTLRQLAVWRDKMVEALSQNDRVTCMELELRFHSGIWEAAGSPWLVAALRRVMVPYYAYSVVHVANSPVGTDLHFEQHDLYLRYLRGLVGQSAEECIRFHVDPFPTEHERLAHGTEKLGASPGNAAGE